MERVIPMNDDDDIVKEFLVERYENLDRLDRDLVMLEKSPNDREILASVFRPSHTIKGTSGFLAFNKLGAVTHVGESLLGRLRDGQLTLDREITTALLTMVDAARQMLTSIETSGVEGERDDSALIARLTLLQRADPPGKTAGKAPAKIPEPGKLKAASSAAGAGALPVEASLKVAKSSADPQPGSNASPKSGRVEARSSEATKVVAAIAIEEARPAEQI